MADSNENGSKCLFLRISDLVLKLNKLLENSESRNWRIYIEMLQKEIRQSASVLNNLPN